MLDQMFTSENFRRIFDSENRKGNDLATRYFPDLQPLTLVVRDKVKEIRELRSKEASIKPGAFAQQLAKLKIELQGCKAEKSATIDEEMERISLRVIKSDFKIALSQKTGPKGKPVFCIDQSPETGGNFLSQKWTIKSMPFLIRRPPMLILLSTKSI